MYLRVFVDHFGFTFYKYDYYITLNSIDTIENNFGQHLNRVLFMKVLILYLFGFYDLQKILVLLYAVYIIDKKQSSTNFFFLISYKRVQLQHYNLLNVSLLKNLEI